MEKKIILRIIFIAIGLIMIFIPTFLYAYFEMIKQPNPLGLILFGIPTFFFISIAGGIICIYGLYSTIKEMRKSYEETEEATLSMIEKEYKKAKTSEVFEEVKEERISKIPELKIISASNEEVCPNCGSLNPLKTQKCNTCGKTIYTISEEKISCPVCGAPLEDIPESGGRIMCKICFSEIQVIT